MINIRTDLALEAKEIYENDQRYHRDTWSKGKK